jgi:putative ABC transport system permease protein
MLKNYFLIAMRRLARNKLSSVIRLISLFIGLVCFSLIAVYVYHELSFDRFNKQADNIARIVMEYSVGAKPSRMAITGTKAGPQLQRIFPSVKSYTRIIRNPKVVKNGDVIFNEKDFLYVDSAFLTIFTFPPAEGNISTALDGPGKIVLTRAMAKKYFGDEDPLGKELVIDGNNIYTVTAVLEDLPDNSQIKFDFLASFVNLDASKTEGWFPANYITYLLLEKGTRITGLSNSIETYTRNITSEETGLPGIDYFSYQLEPLTTVHLHSNLDGLVPNTPFIYIYVLIITAVLILIIACINYANITIARASEQMKETGVRKVLGARRWQLLIHFIGESVILTITAAIFSMIGAMVLLPYFGMLTGRLFTISLLFQPAIIAAIIIVCVLVSLIAGAYPAIIVSGYNLQNILKPGFLMSASGGNFRRSLIVFQFAISIVLIITTLVIQQQRSYIMNKNLGYDKTRVIYLQMSPGSWPNYYNLKAALKQDPYITEVSAGNTTPVEIRWTSTMTAATETGEKQYNTRAIPVDLDFLKTLGIKIIAGSDFTESDFQQLKTLKNSDGFRYSLILNETAVKAIGWTPEESIGRELKIGFPGKVKAVVSDFHIASLHEPVMPLVIFLNDEFLRVILVKMNGNDVPAALSSFKKIWSERMPGRPFEYHFLDEDYDALYKNEYRTAGIFSTFSAIAIMLACLGLFGIVAIMTVQRTKETGIRKIMGADAADIILHLMADYLKPVLIAFIIAVPVAWYAANEWLRGFVYHITIPVWVFIISGLFTIVISMATISIQSVRAALSNPADSLRNE